MPQLIGRLVGLDGWLHHVLDSLGTGLRNDLCKPVGRVVLREARSFKRVRMSAQHITSFKSECKNTCKVSLVCILIRHSLRSSSSRSTSRPHLESVRSDRKHTILIVGSGKPSEPQVIILFSYMYKRKLPYLPFTRNNLLFSRCWSKNTTKLLAPVKIGPYNEALVKKVAFKYWLQWFQ